MKASKRVRSVSSVSASSSVDRPSVLSSRRSTIIIIIQPVLSSRRSSAAMAPGDIPVSTGGTNGTSKPRKPSPSYDSFSPNGSGYSPIGTIPSAAPPDDGGGGTGRPWIELIVLQGFSKPDSFPDAISRARHNLCYFRRNYAIAVLVLVVLSLLWHPISLLVLVFLVAAWIYLYFSRSGDLVIFGRSIKEAIVLAVLTVLTILILALTPGSGTPLLISLILGFLAVILHSVFRRTDFVIVDEQRRSLISSATDIPVSARV